MRLLPGGRTVGLTAPDRLEWVGSNEFRPAGRFDLAVQVGGTNVFPGRVRDLLLQNSQVADAAVRLMGSEEGNRLKAFIVARDEHVDLFALRAQIDDRATKHLRTPEIPKAVSFGNALPRDAAGKLVDWII